MNIKQWFSTYFTNHAETSEEHWNEMIRTHYFKTTKDKAFPLLEDYYRNSNKYKVMSSSKEHGEMSLQTVKGKKAFIVVSVVMVQPLRTAVDFSVTTESTLPFDFGYSHKLIREQQEEMKKLLPFLETSMAHKM
ncbi:MULTISPECIES: cytosolic protein [Pontibacillus]|uniref:Cytosolic protein n=1 Tax=Pontibacillus chungwhensis TaxID=265426 RepID=A0ABY8UZX8_9BACI|nr:MULTISPECIES: cytosolic protein [Pontibacillus]MCD5323818.1 cytosolic protein [Pontibacillus sp. HN14]WIF97181.1 cytosolic protein [Pontibacillus chungwhensis]